MGVCVREREIDTELQWVCVCVCVLEREIDTELQWVCGCVCVCV